MSSFCLLRELLIERKIFLLQAYYFMAKLQSRLFSVKLNETLPSKWTWSLETLFCSPVQADITATWKEQGYLFSRPLSFSMFLGPPLSCLTTPKPFAPGGLVSSVRAELASSVSEQEIAQTSESSFDAGFSCHWSGRTQNNWCSLGLIPIDCGNVKLITDSPFWNKTLGRLRSKAGAKSLLGSSQLRPGNCRKVKLILWDTWLLESVSITVGAERQQNLCCMCYSREVLKSLATSQMLPSCFKVASFISLLEGRTTLDIEYVNSWLPTKMQYCYWSTKLHFQTRF